MLAARSWPKPPGLTGWLALAVEATAPVIARADTAVMMSLRMWCSVVVGGGGTSGIGRRVARPHRTDVRFRLLARVPRVRRTSDRCVETPQPLPEPHRIRRAPRGAKLSLAHSSEVRRGGHMAAPSSGPAALGEEQLSRTSVSTT